VNGSANVSLVTAVVARCLVGAGAGQVEAAKGDERTWIARNAVKTMKRRRPGQNCLHTQVLACDLDAQEVEGPSLAEKSTGSLTGNVISSEAVAGGVSARGG
jgi:hypothetical protein